MYLPVFGPKLCHTLVGQVICTVLEVSFLALLTLRIDGRIGVSYVVVLAPLYVSLCLAIADSVLYAYLKRRKIERDISDVAADYIGYFNDVQRSCMLKMLEKDTGSGVNSSGSSSSPWRRSLLFNNNENRNAPSRKGSMWSLLSPKRASLPTLSLQETLYASVTACLQDTRSQEDREQSIDCLCRIIERSVTKPSKKWLQGKQTMIRNTIWCVVNQRLNLGSIHSDAIGPLSLSRSMEAMLNKVVSSLTQDMEEARVRSLLYLFSVNRVKLALRCLYCLTVAAAATMIAVYADRSTKPYTLVVSLVPLYIAFAIDAVVRCGWAMTFRRDLISQILYISGLLAIVAFLDLAALRVDGTISEAVSWPVIFTPWYVFLGGLAAIPIVLAAKMYRKRQLSTGMWLSAMGLDPQSMVLMCMEVTFQAVFVVLLVVELQRPGTLRAAEIVAPLFGKLALEAVVTAYALWLCLSIRAISPSMEGKRYMLVSSILELLAIRDAEEDPADELIACSGSETSGSAVSNCSASGDGRADNGANGSRHTCPSPLVPSAQDAQGPAPREGPVADPASRPSNHSSQQALESGTRAEESQ